MPAAPAPPAHVDPHVLTRLRVGRDEATFAAGEALRKPAAGPSQENPQVLPSRIFWPVACVVLTALAYYLILFTNLGNLYLGASYLGAVVVQAVDVLAIFSCLEVMRTERSVAGRALAGAFGAPLVLATLLMLWYGIRRWLQT